MYAIEKAITETENQRQLGEMNPRSAYQIGTS